MCVNKEGERRIRTAAVRKPFNKNNNKLTLLPSHIMSIRFLIPISVHNNSTNSGRKKKCVKFHLIAFAMAERPNNLLFRSKLHRRRANENGRTKNKTPFAGTLFDTCAIDASLRFGVHSHKLLDYLLCHPKCALRTNNKLLRSISMFFGAHSPAARSMHTACALVPLSNGELIFQYHRVPGSCYTKLMCKRQAHRIAIEMPKNYHFEHEKLLLLRPEKHTHTRTHSRQLRFFSVRAVTAARILQRILFFRRFFRWNIYERTVKKK